jgi:hypothetical protein
MFGYSLTRPVHNQDYYYGIFDACEKFNCGIEGWHTESGPGVFEAALSFGEIQQMADKAGLFKSAHLSLSIERLHVKSNKSQICRQICCDQIWDHTLLYGETARRTPRKQRTHARFNR